MYSIKNIILRISLFTSLALTILSANANSSTENKASALSNKLINILPKQCVFSGTFIQKKTINSLPKPLTSEGMLFFSCQHGLIWKNTTPFPESLIYTSKNLHFRNTELEQAAPLDGQQHYYLAQFLLNLLSANTDSLNEKFLIEDNNSDKESDLTKTANSLTLSPKNSFIKKGLDSITIEKRQESENTKETLLISINDPKGQATLLEISNLTTYSKKRKADIENDCKYATSNNIEDISCDILSNPQRYQTVESNN